MDINLERIKHDIETIGSFSSNSGAGITRFSYSESDRQAREYLLIQFKNLGLKITIDGVGNIIARLEGTETDAPPVMTGSHIDTVLHGGLFDGVVGVVGALEVVRVLIEEKIRTKHPIEIVIFVEEEGSNFGSTMAGSKTMIGKYSVQKLKELKTDEGLSMYDLSKKMKFNPEDAEKFVVQPGDIKSMIEMHVEQSVILDIEKIPIGIVENIAGIKTFKIECKGISNHAGATPMHLRKNPMQAAAELICEIEKIVKEKANNTTVGTVGKIICYPNVSNIIPETVIFTLDIRDIDPEGINITVKEVKKKMKEVTVLHGVKLGIQLIGEADPIKLSTEVINTIEEAANEMGVTYKRMNSGAVHDSSLLADVTNVGMIFVPSINGRSHVPEENTNYLDIKLGCELLLRAILKLAN